MSHCVSAVAGSNCVTDSPSQGVKLGTYCTSMGPMNSDENGGGHGHWDRFFLIVSPEMQFPTSKKTMGESWEHWHRFGGTSAL